MTSLTPIQLPTEGSDDADFIEAARQLYGSEGQIEIDDHALVSRGGDPGAYVQAWVWVSHAEPTEKACWECNSVLPADHSADYMGLCAECDKGRALNWLDGVDEYLNFGGYPPYEGYDQAVEQHFASKAQEGVTA